MNRLSSTDASANQTTGIIDCFATMPVPPERTRTREVLHAAIETLRVTTDDVAAQAIDVVATELADVADRLSVRELMLSEAVRLAHDQRAEINRLRIRCNELLDLARSARKNG